MCFEFDLIKYCLPNADELNMELDIVNIEEILNEEMMIMEDSDKE